MTEQTAKTPTYGNWQLPKSPGLMGLDLMGSAVLIAAVLTTIFAIMLGGMLAGVAVVGSSLPLIALLIVKNPATQRNGLQRTFVRLAWWQTRSAGNNHYRSGPLGKARWGTHQLPGLLANTKLNEYLDGWNRPFAVLELPTHGHFSIVFQVEPEGSSLVDETQQHVWVDRFGHVLSNLADEPGLVACMITIETAPDTGTRLQDHVQARIDPDAPAFAQQVLRELADGASGGAEVKAWVAMTFDSSLHGKRMGVDEFADELRPRLPGLGEQFHGSGVGGARPLSCQQCCELTRAAYDPAAAALIERNNLDGIGTPLLWSDVGPAAHEASWDSYRHDGAVSVTWSMTRAPLGEVHSNILKKLLEPHRSIPRKRVSLVYRLMDTGAAARTVEADKRNAGWNARNAKNPSEQVKAAMEKASKTAQEQTRGAALVDFSLLVTATVAGDDLEAQRHAEATVENLGATARLALRRVYGSQDSAFVGNLPLGVVLPEYLRVPRQVRQATR
jgi:hypothetical protein